MSVILEFSIGSEDFELGQVLSGPADMSLELERLVPTGAMVVPFVWATGDDRATFEEHVRNHARVKEFITLDKVGDSGLYRIEWKEEPMDLIEAIARSDAVILEARGDRTWTFRLRFPTHEHLTRFHNAVIEQEIPLHIDRTYTLTEVTEHGHRFGLSGEQREALVLALQRGYFETPSEVGLDDLAEELGITRQAVSNRIRRGNEAVLRHTLLTSAGAD
jgi:predicted DNA binding protein